jgi:hypothetical protein
MNEAFIESNSTLPLNPPEQANMSEMSVNGLPNISMVEQEASEMNITPIPHGDEANHFLDMMDNVEPIEPVNNNGSHDMSMGGKRKKQGGGRRTRRTKRTKRTKHTRRNRHTKRTKRTRRH